MLKFSFFTGGLLLSIATLAHSADSVGFRNTGLDEGGPRPLRVAIWYPTEDPADTGIVGENRVFHGIAAIKDAATGPGTYPLVVLSHGYRGSWRNLNWLAAELAEMGYIVAAPDHPGTSTFDTDPQQAVKLRERPRDLSRVIDALTADPQIAGEVDGRRVAAIGHSLGGWTVAALGGAQFDTRRFEKDCEVPSSPRACSLSVELGLKNPDIETSMADPRIGAFVSLDLGLSRGFSPESLESIRIPSLVIGAGTDIGGLPAKLESGYLAENLPETSSTYVEIPDAMHFSFMQICKQGAVELVEDETPGDGIVCKDGGTRSRGEIHREISFLVTGFLARAIPSSQ